MFYEGSDGNAGRLFFTQPVTGIRTQQQLLEFTTKEGSKAVYGGSLFRIENVIFVTSLRDATSKRREEERREKKKAQSFEHAFQEACSQAQQPEISYTTNGYTKYGAAYSCIEKRREYIHQKN